jgi:hypothetical protein
MVEVVKDILLYFRGLTNESREQALASSTEAQNGVMQGMNFRTPWTKHTVSDENTDYCVAFYLSQVSLLNVY